MKNLTIICILFFSGNFLIAQNCTANFSFGDTDLTIDFFDESISQTGDPIVSWSWDFEVGSSTEQNPTFTFPDPDRYDVCLTITTQNGCTNTACVEIETCVLQTTVTTGDCDANGNIPITINISDPYDAAQDINVSVDGVLVAGSPFRIRDDQPVLVNTTVVGDGLEHVVLVNSEDVGTCSSTTYFTVPDCSSDCFLSSMGIQSSGGFPHTIDVGDDFFSPDNLTITIGDVVDFVWVGDGHSTTSDATSGPDSWNSGVIGFGSNYTVNITNPGVHRYYCIPHGGPGGTGMSGLIVANCPPSGQFELTINFNTSVADPAGYQVLVDGSVAFQGNYNGTGPQSAIITLAGDGQDHLIEVRDVNDPTCSISRNYLAPDCGAAPSCSLSVMATEAGGCNANDEVPVELTVSAINPGSSGFSVLVNGNNAGTFAYDPSGTTIVTVNLTGNGQNQTITVEDNDDPTCSGSTNITTTNCTIPCLISNLSATTGSAITHTVEVQDFDFFPRDITITAGDIVEWVWTGAVDHTTTSDATSGPDSWDSGLLGQGATYTSPALSAGLHPYYCIPHGAPGGVGMAGTITVQADCTNGQVAVGVSFSAQGGGFSGYEILVDGQVATSGAYDPSGQNSASVLVPGDGGSHSISVRDAEDATCAASTSISTPDCNAPTCSVSIEAMENGACDANDEVPVQITVSDVGGGASGFTLSVDGAVAGTFAYSGNGTTVVTLNVNGDGQNHTIQVQDLEAAECNAATSLTTTNCATPCNLSNLQLQVAGETGGIVHTIEVQDFEFIPATLSLRLGDTVRFVWTGAIPHTATSDANSGPDVFDSELLGQGAVYDVVLNSLGSHPYYCIPHGAPGGIGMAGTLEVLPPCENGLVSVGLSFLAEGTSESYQIWVDGMLYPGGPFPYTPLPVTQTIELTGDGQSHLIQVRDNVDENCFVQALVSLPDCGEQPSEPCQLSLSSEVISDCDDNGQLEVALQIDHQNNGGSFQILLDGLPITDTPLPYAATSPTTTTIMLSGSGNMRTLSVIDQDSTNCRADSELMLPDCQVICLVSELEVQSGNSLHTVEVRDFDFFPQDLSVQVGDTVRFVWTGVVPHTTTSDATAGPDSWDSGLLGEGATYEVVIQNEGTHPYYCIPHGGPGGIGMAGTITATEVCDNGQAIVNVNFNVSNGSPLGYRIFLDGELVAGPLPYDDPQGQNTVQIGVAGDAGTHTLTVQDMEVDFCAASTSFMAPDCPALCLIDNLQIRSGAEVVHIVQVEDFVFEPSHLRVRIGETIRFVWTGEIPHTTTSDATTGPDSWASELLGQGDSYEITIQEAGLHPYYCVPHGGPGGIGMAGVIEALPNCTADSLAYYELNFAITNGSMQGYRVFVGGEPLTEGPFSYDNPMGSNALELQLPSYGQQLVVTVQDLEPPFCAATVSTTASDCRPTCALQALADTDWACTENQASTTVSIISQAGSAEGFNIWIDGQLSSASPYPYTGDTSNLSLSIPNDGFEHTLIFADLANENCRDTLQLIPDCPGTDCSMQMESVQISPNRRHEILVRDFDFLPLQLDVVVGDTVDFVWIGDVPHTATSDTDDGPDSFNSGLLGNGALYSVVITTPGEHPYYCIPHGSPGGIGMAGNITAVDDCADDLLSVEVQFRVQFPRGERYEIRIDNATVDSRSYTNSSIQSFSLELPGDGGIYPLSLLDVDDNNCQVDTLIKMPDCDDPCYIVEADFSYALTPTPRTIQFTDLSSEAPDGRQWDFGDGNTSSAVNPLLTYASSGDYTVCLIAENMELGCQDTLCQMLSISDNLCEANFTYVIDGLNVQFTDASLTSSPITERLWQFSNGIQISNQETPSYTFAENAVYEVCLQIVTDECTATYCDSIDLSDPCLTFTANFQTQAGEGLEMRFFDQTSGTPNQWLWGFGDGRTSTEQFPTHSYESDGVYRVCLLVQDTLNGCNDVYCIDQQVGTVGTRQPLRSSNLAIFPNPVSNTQTYWSLAGWQTAALGQSVEVRILNIRGQVLQRTVLAAGVPTRLDLQTKLAAGVYLVEARSSGRYYVGKVVVN